MFIINYFYIITYYCLIKNTDYYFLLLPLFKTNKFPYRNGFYKIWAVSRPMQHHTYIISLCTIFSAVILTLFISPIHFI